MALNNRYLAVVCSTILALGLLSASNGATAQNKNKEVGSKDPVTADYKGMVGLGLIGAELGFVLPTVCGLDETWSLIVFPIVGAGGGAVGGYFLLERGDGHPEAAVAVLTAGMALLIPSAVLTLAMTAYDPEEDSSIKSTQATAPLRPRASNVRRMAQAAGPGLVRWSPDGVFISAPAITPVFAMPAKELRGPSLRPRTELRVALLSGRF